MTTSPLRDPCFPLVTERPFTRSMAVEGGLKDKQLHRLCKAGWLRRPIRGVYVASDAPDTLELRAAVLELVVPSGCFISDHTAAWLHAGDIALPPNAHLATPSISVFRPPREGRLRNGIAVSGERTILPHDLMTIGDLLVTTPLRTALDLGRLQRNPDVALAGMDRMLALGCFTHEELLSNVSRFNRQRGVVQLRALAPLADGRSESFGESALRNRWYDAGLPRPELQVPVMVDGRVVFLLDIALEEMLFAAEYDGEQWHSSDEDRAHDEHRRDWLSRNRAWQIEVFRAVNVFGMQQNASEILRDAYLEARATLGQRLVLV